MERISAKHGARLDDELARETETLTRATPAEARAEEWRMAEPPADDEPLADARLAGDLPGSAPGALPADEIEARADLAAALRPTAFPADAATLRRVAEEEGAPAWVLDVLRRVDQVTRFETVGELWRAAGGHADGGNGREPDTELRVAPAPESASGATIPAAPEPVVETPRATQRARSRSRATTATRPTNNVTPTSDVHTAEATDGPTAPSTDGGNVVGRGVDLVVGVGVNVAREGVRTGRRFVRGALRLVGR